MLENKPFVSIIIPCRNEVKYMSQTIESIINQTYPKEFLEVILVDGLSEDGTLNIIKSYCSKYPSIKYCINEHQIVPHAMNIGIANSRGEIIVRMDAHCIYPLDYIEKLTYYLHTLEADNVGGVWITNPANSSLTAKAIAEATSSSFGIGNAQYRLKNSVIKQVDTVPFGCYKKEVFEKIGYFDEDLIRNQDDEFNARLIKNGGKIYLIPEVQIQYFARESLKKICKMFYQYGLFKPLVNKKVGKPATIRQFFPLAFLSLLISTPLTYLIGMYPLFLLCLVLLITYFSLNIFYSLKISKNKKNIAISLILPIVFLLIHLSYGWGYLRGIIIFTILNKKIKPIETSLSR